MSKIYRSLTVCQEDLKSVGNTFYVEKGCLSVICDLHTAHIEEILLREILKCFGEFEITGAEDFEWTTGVLDIKLTTNLPISLCSDIIELD